MSDPSTSPPPVPPAGGGWWLAWILATVIAPGLAMPLVNGLPNSKFSEAFCWTGLAVILILHLVSATKLSKERSGCLAVSLVFGGWALMLASFFIGCVSVMNNMSHR